MKVLDNREEQSGRLRGGGPVLQNGMTLTPASPLLLTETRCGESEKEANKHVQTCNTG